MKKIMMIMLLIPLMVNAQLKIKFNKKIKCDIYKYESGWKYYKSSYNTIKLDKGECYKLIFIDEKHQTKICYISSINFKYNLTLNLKFNKNKKVLLYYHNKKIRYIVLNEKTKPLIKGKVSHFLIKDLYADDRERDKRTYVE